eukprot:3386678-Rhodomonas_salina.2
MEHAGPDDRTPPCSEALVLAGVGRVVVAMVDPNPLVDSQGLRTIRDSNVQPRLSQFPHQSRVLRLLRVPSADGQGRSTA